MSDRSSARRRRGHHGHQLLFDERPNPVADQYRVLIAERRLFLAFHTVMELRFGAIRAGWGELRRRRLEWRIAELSIVQPDDEMITVCASAELTVSGPDTLLATRIHDGDRWIAAARAIRLRLPLVSMTPSSRMSHCFELITADQLEKSDADWPLAVKARVAAS